jgi:hypothetical protein
MNPKVQLIAAAECDPSLARELRAWFEQEFGRADRWAEADFYVVLRFEEQLAGRLATVHGHVSAGGIARKVSEIG